MSRFQSPVTRYMSAPVVSVPSGADLNEALVRLEERSLNCLAVVGSDGKLVGAISRTDLLKVGRLRAHMADDGHVLSFPHVKVSQRMSVPPLAVDPWTSMAEAAALMVEHHVHQLFIVENDEPLGVVTTTDMMRAVIDERVELPISEVMTTPVMTIQTWEPLGRAVDRLAEAHVRGLVVVEEEWPVGIFTQAEALSSHALDPGTPVEEAMSYAMLCLPTGMPVHRAARFAIGTRARRILGVEMRELKGILTAVDLTKVAARAPAGDPDAME